MGRFISDRATSISNNQAAVNLTNKITPASLIGSIVVPDGVTSAYITGVAAGARASADTRLSAQPAIAAAVGISPSGNFVIGSQANATVSTPVITYDPIARKQCLLGGGPSAETAVDINYGGLMSAVSDNGFMFVHGPAGGHWSIDAGASWVNFTSIYPAAAGYGYGSVALRTVAADDDKTQNRAVLISSLYALSYFTGSEWKASGNYATANFVKAGFVDCYFYASSNSATDKTAIYYGSVSAIDTLGIDNLTKVVIDAALSRNVLSIKKISGLYVALCGDGSIYTAGTLGGPWTQRVSGINSGIALIEGGTRLLAIGSGVATVTTDGMTWTVATTSLTGIDSAVYCPRTGHFVAAKPSGLKNLYHSVDCITWTNHISVDYSSKLIGHPAGLLVITGSGTTASLLPDPSKTQTLPFDTSGDGGDLVVMRQSDRKELLRLKGAAGREGGCSYGRMTLDGATAAGSGMDGQGYAAGYAAGSDATLHYSPSTGQAITGGGQPPQVWDIGPEMYGIKIPGGSAGLAGTSTTAGGGGSIFAKAAFGRAIGYGAGASTTLTASAAGGGGEGIVRFRIEVTPGEVLLYSSGMAMGLAGVITNPGKEPTRGFICFEFA